MMPSKEIIETLAQSSAGDIRAAINTLQFFCLRGKGINFLEYIIYCNYKS